MDDLISIERIKQKLSVLKELDLDFSIFGAKAHHYLLNPPASESEIKEFEARYQITLPSSYREFIKKVGNGGAGPYYGLESLEDTVFPDLDYKNKNNLLDPSKPFLLSEPWNIDFGEVTEEDEDEYYEEYFNNKWSTGLLRICNCGCGIFLNLVVNGKEYGNIWVDDRCNDGGIYPDPYFDREERTTFLQWYELWLDRAIAETRKG